jgi:hypothetical protein
LVGQAILSPAKLRLGHIGFGAQVGTRRKFVPAARCSLRQQEGRRLEMHFIVLLLWTGQQPPAQRVEQAETSQEQALIEEIARSGRTIAAGDTDSSRVAVRAQVPAGAPPLLSFRYFEGKQRYRFGDVDLMLDDAGH